MSIQKRTAWTALFLIFVISAAGAAATWWEDRDITRLIDMHALQSMQSIEHYAENSQRRELELKTAILAGNSGFVGYISQAISSGSESGGVIDAASIRDLLEERRNQYGFDVAAILDPAGRSIVVLGDALRARQDFSSTPLLAKVRASFTASIDLFSYNGRLILVSLSPMLRGDAIEALLLTGVEINSRFVVPVAEASRVDLALIGISGSNRSVVASTLGAEDHQAILDAVSAEPAVLAGIVGAGANADFDLSLVGGRTRASIAPLFDSPSSGLLVSIVPVEQRIVSTGAIRTPMMIAGGVVLAVLLVVWWMVQRGIVRPITNLVEMSDRVLRGDIQVFARDVGKGDVSMIAAAFNQALSGLRGYKETLEKREARN
jgi:eukaryotic-like serine/threonine-protein kinase